MNAKTERIVCGLLIAGVFLPALLLPGVGALVSALVVALALILLSNSRRPTLALVWRSVPASILLGMAVGTATAIGFSVAVEPLIAALTGEPVDLSDFDAVRGSVPNYLVMLAVGLIFGGIVEEVIFRGAVIGWGSAAFGKRLAWPLAVLSATVFGITHLYQGWSGVISTGLMGLILGALYVLCSRRLLPCIAAHMTNNAIGITAIYLGMG